MRTAALTPTLADSVGEAIDARLADTDALLESAYPGEDGRRQPVHTVYVPADRYVADLPVQWGAQARDLVENTGGWSALGAELGLADDLAEQVIPRAERKLQTEPIEDLRIDFEDGYGDHGDDAEDAEVTRCVGELTRALEAGSAPPFVGLRFKCFEAPTRRRGLRTLDLFLTALLQAVGKLPDNLVITFPKVSTVSQVEAMVAVCEQFEAARGLASGLLRFEIQVETPQLILGADGRASIAEALHAGDGRITSLHYGTYDYSASVGVAAQYQSMSHPAADYAKTVMQVAVAGTGVHLSDGSTNVLPVGSPDQVWAAWRLHAGLVRRSLERAYYQGWDLHPGQLPTRFLATFAFYREGYAPAARRLADYVHHTGSGILDEPATARALARYLHRGFVCGSVDAAELHADTGLDPDALERLARPKSDTENVASPVG